MEVIARINDFACECIDMGYYQTSLDALNCCLGCVKQLKNQRTKTSGDRSELADGQQKRTEDTVLRMLKGAERKIMKRLGFAATTVTAEVSSVPAVSQKTTSKKRKASTAFPSKATATLGSTVSRSPCRKMRRDRIHENNSSTLSRPVNTTTTSNTTTSSQESKCPSRSDSVATPSHTNSTIRNARKHERRQYESQKNCHELEERFFVHCKPFRMTKFQWSRVHMCQYSSTFQTTSVESDRESKDQLRLDREVELAVSSNLIFNIALTHHLIAWSREQRDQSSRRILCEEDNLEGEFETDDENGCGYESTCSTSSSNSSDSIENELRNEERLRGALRLYELGFRIHTKRVAYITALQTTSSIPGPTAPSSSSPTSLYPSSSSAPTTISFTSTPMTAMRGDRSLLSNLQLTEERSVSSFSSSSTQATESSLSSSQFILRSDRETELRSTTRFALALINNCAHIHEKLGQTGKAKIFRKRLLSFLLVIIDSGESIHDIIGDQFATDGYLQNVFDGTVFNKETAPAPVA